MWERAQGTMGTSSDGSAWVPGFFAAGLLADTCRTGKAHILHTIGAIAISFHNVQLEI